MFRRYGTGVGFLHQARGLGGGVPRPGWPLPCRPRAGGAHHRSVGGRRLCFTETFIVAERGGVLFGTDRRVWVGWPRGRGAGSLRAAGVRTPEDQVRFRARLARLHDDADLRRHWLEVSTGCLRRRLTTRGRRAVDAAEAVAWDLRARVPEVGYYADIAPLVQGCDFGGLLPRLVATAPRRACR